MRLNAGIITEKHIETKKFYTEILGFGVTFENDFYLLLHTPDKKDELAFLLPNHPSQQAVFHTVFAGTGLFLTLELEDIDTFYTELQAKDAPIIVELKDESWGDRHFTIIDPNGIAIDIVRYQQPEE